MYPYSWNSGNSTQVKLLHLTFLSQAERQLDFVREKAKGPTAQAVSKLNSFKDSIFTSKPKVDSCSHTDSHHRRSHSKKTFLF